MAFYVLLLAVVIACMVALSYCDKPVGAVAATHSGGDTLDIAIEYSPMTYYTYDDTLGGFNYDMLRLVSREAGRPMKFHPIVTLEKGLEGLDTGLYDVLVAQFPITASSRAHYLFTDSIYIDRQVLVQRADALRVKSQLQLAHDTVHVVLGSSMEERIASLGREIGDTIYVITEDTYGPDQLAMLVSTGEIKMAVFSMPSPAFNSKNPPMYAAIRHVIIPVIKAAINLLALSFVKARATMSGPAMQIRMFSAYIIQSPPL